MELKLKGLKKLSSETKNLSGYYSGKYIQVNYDPKTVVRSTNIKMDICTQQKMELM